MLNRYRRGPAGDAPNERAGWIYWMETDSEFGILKIGWSRNVSKRRIELERKGPYRLRVLAQAPGTPNDESNAHVPLAAFRLPGKKDWFRATPESRAIAMSIFDKAHQP